MPIRSIPVPAPVGDLPAKWPDPPCSGNWRRLEDGALIPDDEATARGAGLWDEPAPPPAEQPENPEGS